MVEEDDESFGDFAFASLPPKPTVDPQINAQNPTPTPIVADSNSEDDEWGDFLDYSPGSDPSNGPSQPEPFDPCVILSTHRFQHPIQSTRLCEQATGQIKSPETVQWVKPRGALSLSLFGEEEDEEKPDMAVESAHTECQFAKEETNKLSNGPNTGSSIGLNHILDNLYSQNPKFQSGEPSSNASESGNLIFDFDLSKLDLNSGLSAVKKDLYPVHNFDWNLTGAELKSQAVESISMEWSRDLNKLGSEQTVFPSNISVDVTDLSDHSERIKREDAVHGVACSIDTPASSTSYGCWGFDSAKFGSTSKSLNSSFNRLNSKSDAMGACVKSDTKNTDSDCDDGWEFKDSFTEERDGGTKNKAGSEAQEIYESNTYVGYFGNGSNRPVDWFPVSNRSSEADSLIHYMRDMQAFSSGFSNGLVVTNESVKAIPEAHDASALKANLSWYSESANHSIDLFTASNGSSDLFATANVFSGIIQEKDVESNNKPSDCAQNHFISDSFGTSEGRDENDIVDYKLSEGSEADDDFGEFTAAFSDSGSKQDVKLRVTGIIQENDDERNNTPSACAQNHFISDSYGTSERRDENVIVDYKLSEGAEADDDFGEFTAAFSDSGSKQDVKLRDLSDEDLSHELQAAKFGGKHQVNMSGSNYEGALPFSVVGNEELEIDASSTTNDGFICHQIPFPKSDKKQKPGISINDGMPSLYNQAENTSSVSFLNHLSDVVEPPYSGGISNLLNDDYALGDESWVYKCDIPQRRDHEEQHPSSLSIRKLDNYVEFYSGLKKELCLHSKYHLANCKGADKEVDDGSSICEGDDITTHPSWEICCHEFIEVLKKPKFQVLESEYNISRRLSQIKIDFNSAVELISHASTMINLLTLVSVKEQLFYVSIWDKMISVCTRELQHGTWLWKQILDKDAQNRVLSNTRGRKYILGLGEIYKAAVVLEASVKLYQPWTWLNDVDFTSIRSLLDECHALWSSSGLGQAILGISDPESTSNIRSIHDIDAFNLQKRLFCQNGVTCRLSLLTSGVLHELGMKLVIWNGEHCFVTLANMWANLISDDPPELPHLSLGR